MRVQQLLWRPQYLPIWFSYEATWVSEGKGCSTYKIGAENIRAHIRSKNIAAHVRTKNTTLPRFSFLSLDEVEEALVLVQLE
jgi:hypothetical protein